MSTNIPFININSKMPNWLTIQEAVNIVNQETNLLMSESDIYRHALYGAIRLSIYFQSPIILRKTKISGKKVSLISIDDFLPNRLCFLDKNCFINRRNLIACTKGEYISPTHTILDTPLLGHEYVEIQRILAHSLHIPRPVAGISPVNYGISVMYAGELFQVFESESWSKRITQQIMRLPRSLAKEVYQQIADDGMAHCYKKKYFPIHYLPSDACFVIRKSELEKLTNMRKKTPIPPPSSARISTPLSRLFWLACRHNEVIAPLINHPYKLAAIFQQWALANGINENLSGDTLKAALERGKPISTKRVILKRNSTR